jgi:hypothetical protein
MSDTNHRRSNVCKEGDRKEWLARERERRREGGRKKERKGQMEEFKSRVASGWTNSTMRARGRHEWTRWDFFFSLSFWLSPRELDLWPAKPAGDETEGGYVPMAFAVAGANNDHLTGHTPNHNFRLDSLPLNLNFILISIRKR